MSFPADRCVSSPAMFMRWSWSRSVASGPCSVCAARYRGSSMTTIDRQKYDASFGPTTGDRGRLADTNLFVEVEEDRCGGGDELVFGGGKSARESMGQSAATRAEGTPD